MLKGYIQPCIEINISLDIFDKYLSIIYLFTKILYEYLYIYLFQKVQIIFIDIFLRKAGKFNVPFHNVPPKSYSSKVLQSIEHSQVTCWIWDQNLMISYCTSDIGIFPLRFLSALRRNKYIARYIR